MTAPKGHQMIKTLAIAGMQWGDEGKGKLVHYLSEFADVVVRWAGGNNAGHSIEFGNKRFSLRSIPSGIFYPQCLNVIGAGCVVNLEQLVSEIDYLQSKGFSTKNLKIAGRAHLILPHHIQLDIALEKSLGSQAVGTTKNGIGPCYAEKVQRTGLRVADLLTPTFFRNRLKASMQKANQKLVNVYGLAPLDFEATLKQWMELTAVIKDYIVDASLLVNEAIDQGKKVLFEGAQGAMLDLDFGTYPFVTSSHPVASAIPANIGFGAYKLQQVLGVIKAYTSRVGNGVLPTEILGATADKIIEVGHEYGTVTKRRRRVGWLDIVALKNACRINGVQTIAVMLLDVLTGISRIKICVGYRKNNDLLQHPPLTLAEYQKCTPEYITLPGWTEDITKVTTFEDLPMNARKYLLKIAELLGVQIGMVSVGPERSQSILIKQDFWGEQ